MRFVSYKDYGFPSTPLLPRLRAARIDEAATGAAHQPVCLDRARPLTAAAPSGPARPA